MQFDFKKIRIDILAVVIFAVGSLLYCYPQLQGKKFMGSDNTHWMGMAREGMAYHDSTGKEVLWSNSMFGGMPTYTTYVASSNTNYVSYVQNALQAIGKPAYFFFIAMMCFYILMRVLGVNRWLGVVGAFAYAFASYNAIIISVGHDTKMLTIGFMPAALAGFYLIYKGNWLPGAALFGIAMALMAGNNHYQVMYYFGIILICFAIGMFFAAIKDGSLKQFFFASGIALVTGVVGVGPGMNSLITTNEYTKETMRGGGSELSGHDKKTNGGLDKDYAFSWSSGIGETFCLMIPYLYGGATVDNADMAPKTLEAIGGGADKLPIYWGEQPSQAGPVFFGAIVCFLFVLGLVIIRSPHRWWMLAASIIGIVLAWGKNLPSVNYFLFDHVPMLNKFRTVEMALVIPQFLFPLLGVWAVQEVLDKKIDAERLWKGVKIAAGITAGICILLGLAGSVFFDFSGWRDAQFQPEMVKLLKEDRAALTMKSSLKSAVYIILAAALLWAYIKDRINSTILVAGLGLLVVIDLLPVSLNYLNSDNFSEDVPTEEYFQQEINDRHESEAYKNILADKDPYFRVLDFSQRDPFNDAVQAYYFKCVGGYHPAKMEIYQDLIERQISKFNIEVLNMLNTKYIIVPNKDQNGQHLVQANRSANGNAWFVDEVKWANTADEEMDGLNAPGLGDTSAVPGAFDSKKTAVMRATFKDVIGNYTFGKDSAAYVKLDKYGLDDISFVSSNSQNGLAVFSDIYYAKGWKAYVDGKETPIVKANYVLRAIKIPAGQHKIEFQFRPESFYTGKKIAMVSSIILILLVIGALFQSFKKAPAQQ